MQIPNYKYFGMMVLSTLSIAACSPKINVCLETPEYDFSKIFVKACANESTLVEESNQLWTNVKPIELVKCEVIDFYGDLNEQNKLLLGSVYVNVLFSDTYFLGIVDITNENKWERTREIYYSSVGLKNCDTGSKVKLQY